MTERAVARLRDMKRGIADIRAILHGSTRESLDADRAKRAAYERFLESVSEASRHVPADWKERAAPHIPWRRVADLGNHLRHAYRAVDTGVLWNIYRDELDPLEAAVDAMILVYDTADDV